MFLLASVVYALMNRKVRCTELSGVLDQIVDKMTKNEILQRVRQYEIARDNDKQQIKKHDTLYWRESLRINTRMLNQYNQALVLKQEAAEVKEEERNGMLGAIHTLQNHSQYYIPTQDLFALIMAIEALEEKYKALYGVEPVEAEVV